MIKDALDWELPVGLSTTRFYAFLPDHGANGLVSMQF